MKQVSVRKTQKDPDVAPYLPETIHLEPDVISFDKANKELYDIIATELRSDLLNAQELFGGSFSLEAHYGGKFQPRNPADEMRGRIMSKITAMRMLCDHPDLLRNSATKAAAKDGEGSEYLLGLSEEGRLDKPTKSP
jgi:hypothetical protein